MAVDLQNIVGQYRVSEVDNLDHNQYISEDSTSTCWETDKGSMGYCETIDSGFISGPISQNLDDCSSTISQSESGQTNITCSNECSNESLYGRSVEELNAAFSIMLLGEKQYTNPTCDYAKEEEIFLSMNKQLFQQDLISKDTQLMLMIVNAQSEKDQHTIVTALEYVLEPTQLNVQNDHMQTALILSVLCNLSHVTSHLVTQGASVHLLDRYGNSAFHYACELGSTDCLYSLTTSLKGQNDMHVLAWQNKQGHNCVDLAINNKRIEVFDYLIEKFNVDINYQDKRDGSTALHKAAVNRDLEMVAVLLQYRNINVNARNFSGLTSLRLLYSTDGDTQADQTIEKLLLSYGAMP